MRKLLTTITLSLTLLSTFSFPVPTLADEYVTTNDDTVTNTDDAVTNTDDAVSTSDEAVTIANDAVTTDDVSATTDESLTNTDDTVIQDLNGSDENTDTNNIDENTVTSVAQAISLVASRVFDIQDITISTPDEYGQVFGDSQEIRISGMSEYPEMHDGNLCYVMKAQSKAAWAQGGTGTIGWYYVEEKTGIIWDQDTKQI